MKDKINLMIDIETISTRPDSAIISVAGVFWRNFEPTPLATYYAPLNVDEQLHKMNRKADWGTIKWWSQQDSKSEAFQGGKSNITYYNSSLEKPQEGLSTHTDEERVHFVLMGFLEWIHKNCENLKIDIDKDLLIWSKSPSFDLVIISTLLKQEGFRELGKFWNWRDVRTFVNLNDVIKKQMRDKVDHTMYSAHLPIDDCMMQINEVCIVNDLLEKNINNNDD